MRDDPQRTDLCAEDRLIRCKNDNPLIACARGIRAVLLNKPNIRSQSVYVTGRSMLADLPGEPGKRLQALCH